jgi:hypothetical protein
VVFLAVDVLVVRVLPETPTPRLVAVVAAEVGGEEAATENYSPTETRPEQVPVTAGVIQT